MNSDLNKINHLSILWLNRQLYIRKLCRNYFKENLKYERKSLKGGEKKKSL